MKHTLDVMISEEEIAQRISELADSISTHYQDKHGELVLVGLLKGSFIFMADLC
ncbi:hypoxanthine phosphoribosyltransferase, partial [Enterobacter cloacae complex sp.6701988]